MGDEATAAPSREQVPSRAARRYGRQLDEDDTEARGTARSCRCCCFYGWFVWLLLTLAQISTFFGTSSAVTFVIEPIMAELKLSRSLVSLSYGIATGIGAAVQVPIGRLVDQFGGRKGVAVCSALYFLSLMAMALPHEWVMLTLAFGAMRALGFGGLALACNTCLQQWFVRRRGLVTGLSESLNTLVGFGLCSQFYAAVVRACGWRESYVLIGGALLLYTPLAALLLRSRPEDIGLAPDGGGGEALARKAAPITGWTLGEACRTSALWVVVAGNALMWGIGAGVFFHLVSVVGELQLSVTLLPSLFYLPWASARAASLVLGGWLLDRVHPRLVLAAGFVLGAATFLIFGWPAATLTPSRTVAIAVAWGFAMGLGKATFAVCPAKFYGRRHLGAIQGLLQTTNVASTAVGPLIVGVAHDVLGTYRPIVRTIAALYLAMGTVGAALLETPQRKSRATEAAGAAEAASAAEAAEDVTEAGAGLAAPCAQEMQETRPARVSSAAA